MTPDTPKHSEAAMALASQIVDLIVERLAIAPDGSSGGLSADELAALIDADTTELVEALNGLLDVFVEQIEGCGSHRFIVGEMIEVIAARTALARHRTGGDK